MLKVLTLNRTLQRERQKYKRPELEGETCWPNIWAPWRAEGGVRGLRRVGRKGEVR